MRTTWFETAPNGGVCGGRLIRRAPLGGTAEIGVQRKDCKVHGLGFRVHDLRV